MAEATISRVRMRDLARLGHFRSGRRPASAPAPVRALHDAESPPRPSGHRRRLVVAPQSGQLTPRTCDLVASPI